MYKYVFFFLLGCGSVSTNAQINSSFAFASADQRKEQEKKLLYMIDKTVTLPFTPTNFSSWKSACWAMELMLYKPATYTANIPSLLNNFAEYDVSMQWILLQNIFTLFPKQFVREVAMQWQFAKSSKIKALIAAYLQNANKPIVIDQQDSFFQSNYYKAYIKYYFEKQTTSVREDIFLNDALLPKQNLLISFQHRNRDVPGYLMIRKSDGTWASDMSGKPYRFVQLARSITNMPYFLTNGNTPQGLYRVNGFDQSNNAWIGPTTNLQMVMPFEEDVKISFFNDTTTAENKYAALLGPLANISALWQSFEAGKLGRSEIIAHGTTIPEAFYKAQPYYPCTPSLGCLCSPEQWDKNGKLVSSVQQQWIQLVQQLPAQPNWLLVVEL